MNSTLSRQSFRPQVGKLKIQFCIKLGLVVLQLLYLTGCGAATPYPTPTLTPTTTLTPTFTSTPIMTPTITPTSTPSWVVRRNNDCFVATGFAPGKAKKEDVLAIWGQPARIEFLSTDYEWWYYGSLHIRFDRNVVQEATYYLDLCALGDVVVTLGQPEIVELTTLHSCFDLSASYLVTFHYSSRGFSFTHLCPYRSTEEECLSFHPSDDITVKDFYRMGKKITNSGGFNMSSTVFEWTGFVP